jgi:hypothetical protein
MFLIIATIAAVWIILSAFFLVTVCMMSSFANRTELLTEDQLPRRRLRFEEEALDEVTSQTPAEAPIL